MKIDRYTTKPEIVYERSEEGRLAPFLCWTDLGGHYRRVPLADLLPKDTNT